jgi:hypothetical protein
MQNRRGQHTDTVLDLYLGGTQIESQLGYQLMIIVSSVYSTVLPRECRY